MPSRSTIARIKRIQSHLQVAADGLIGPATLTAMENALFSVPAAPRQAPDHSLVVSQAGLKQLVQHEISSKAYYNRRLTHPVWPGGGSGVTIGIGYDLGYTSKTQIKKDWQGKVRDADLAKLLSVSRVKGSAAKAKARRIRSVTIPFEAAEAVFYRSTLPRYAAAALKAYPGLNNLHPGAQAAMCSLVYNRGTSVSGSRRKEMKALRPLVEEANYEGMAVQITKMKRLWVGKGLPGLLKRRDDEAELVLDNRSYIDAELVRV